LCTGGIFAVSAALANQLAFTDDTTGPMSYGSIGYLSCKTSARTRDSVGSVDIGGCKDASTCFTQAHSILEDRIISPVVSAFDYIPLVFDTTVAEYESPSHYLLARAGPLHENSIPLAHSLLKLE
jgi:hypothetical protein